MASGIAFSHVRKDNLWRAPSKAVHQDSRTQANVVPNGESHHGHMQHSSCVVGTTSRATGADEFGLTTEILGAKKEATFNSNQCNFQTTHTDINNGKIVAQFKQAEAANDLVLRDFPVVKTFRRSVGMIVQKTINKMNYNQHEQNMYIYKSILLWVVVVKLRW